jgi:2-polyprenyl-3-methyl-5-hydroxy-6-metoxy-1,4-benzoquinol methylase
MSFFPRELAAPVVDETPMIEWEEPGCLLCGTRDWSPLVESPDTTVGGTGLWFAVVQCQRCGLCFTNPRPSPQAIGRFYPSVYRPHRTPRRRRAPRFLDRLRFWRKRKRDNPKIVWRGEGRLLDFGCGGGAFLARMHGQGWQVTGLDVSAAAVNRVRDELGLRAFQGTLPHPALEHASFDVITMWHSLEHVHAPLEVLREANRLLVPGGNLFIAVPNIDSLPFRWFGSAWYGLDLPRHLTHFAPWTLHLMLERAGFHVGPIKMVRHSQWLRSSARLACQRGKGTFWRRLLTAKPPSRLASRYCHLTRQSDCIMVTAERPE